jgi:hypothetical protein
MGSASVIALALTGCSHVPTQFGGSWPLPTERRSSEAIDLARPIVQPVAAGLRVEGYLARQVDATTTAHSHVDVQFVDAAGAVLQEQPVTFTPADLAGGNLRSRPSAHYEVTLAVPSGAARIRVIAHDRPHGS